MDRLDEMRAFVRVVEVGSFSKVGAELGVQQSTVSKWIAALEDRLDVSLIERTARSQRVTEPGQLFYTRCKQILADYEAAEAELQQRVPALVGLLRVGVPAVWGRHYVVPQVPSFLRRHPELELELRLDDRYVGLLDDDLDLVIRVGMPVDSSLAARSLAQSGRRLVAAPAYLAHAPDLNTPRDLREHECLVHTRGPRAWSFTHAGQRSTIEVRGRVSVDDSEATLALAREGLGIALLGSWLVDDDIATGRLLRLLPEYTPPPAAVQALLPPGGQAPPRVTAFLDHLAPSLVALESRP